MVLIFCEVKNKKKNTTGTGHYVNRLAPKNDIKLLVDEYKTSKNDTLIAWNNQKIIDTLETYQAHIPIHPSFVQLNPFILHPAYYM